MRLHDEIRVNCPYCNEPFTVEADPELTGQQFIEDCPVCCAPIELALHVDADGGWRLDVHRDDD